MVRGEAMGPHGCLCFCHSGAVLGCAVHPTGKLALTVGRDSCLRMWNLVDGRLGYVSNVKQGTQRRRLSIS